MGITSDWHIHTHNSCDDASLRIKDLLKEASGKGITDLGITDHLHTQFNLPDIRASRAEFDSVSPGPRIHFGVELSVVSEWEIAEIASGKYENPVYGLRQGGPAGGPLALGMTEEQMTELGVEFVVGGAHWPLHVELIPDCVIRDYHRQNMFLAVHPLVDIVAHPWWWMGHWQDERTGMYLGYPWLDDFSRIPRSMHDEFAGAVKEYETKVEINIGAMVLNAKYPERFKMQYIEYLAFLQERGVTLCVGSDCHSPTYDPDLTRAAGLLERGGVDLSKLWCLPPRF